MAPSAVTPTGANLLHPQIVKDLNRYKNEEKKTIDLVLNQFRCLIADLCQQFNGGHPG